MQLEISNVTSINVKGFRNAAKRRSFFDFSLDESCKILMLQETHGTEFVNTCTKAGFKASTGWFSNAAEPVCRVAVLVQGLGEEPISINGQEFCLIDTRAKACLINTMESTSPTPTFSFL